MARIEKTYALYRGDELLVIGTAREQTALHYNRVCDRRRF